MRQLLALAFLSCALLGHAGGIFNVTDFGAKGDGNTLDFPAINAPTKPGGEKIVMFGCEKVEFYNNQIQT